MPRLNLQPAISRLKIKKVPHITTHPPTSGWLEHEHGRFEPQTNTIRINMGHMHKYHPERVPQEVNHTLLHELIHAAQLQLFPTPQMGHALYSSARARFGYWDSPFEVQAEQVADALEREGMWLLPDIERSIHVSD